MNSWLIPSPAVAIAAVSVMLAVFALTWYGGVRAEGFLNRGERRQDIAGSAIGIVAGGVLLAVLVRFGDTRNTAVLYVTLGGFSGLMGGMGAWGKTVTRRHHVAVRAEGQDGRKHWYVYQEGYALRPVAVIDGPFASVRAGMRGRKQRGSAG